MVSNKFEILEDLLKETIDNQMEGKHQDKSPQEIEGEVTQMEEETTKRKQQEEERELGDESEDMDIKDMDLEGIEKACVDAGNGYAPQE